MAEKEYIIFCDESDKHGRYFSNFYGGVIVGASQYERVARRLDEKKQELNLYGEVKWAKVTELYLPKYLDLMAAFFDEVRGGSLKVRIMFTQNAHVPQGLTKEDMELQYYKLYYQFIKHAFGLAHTERNPGGARLRLYFDELPDSGEKVEKFKGFLLGLSRYARFTGAGIAVSKEDIAEVRSHEHALLQCLDVVLGAMAFRLNDRHKDKPPGARLRGKRTRAKEKLYQFILAEVRKIFPNFNIGITTGIQGDYENRWRYPYSHWLFMPNDTSYEKALTKRGRTTNDPTRPT